MHKKDWEMGHLKSLREEADQDSDSNCSESDDMLTIARETAATNQVKNKSNPNTVTAKSRNLKNVTPQNKINSNSNVSVRNPSSRKSSVKPAVTDVSTPVRASSRSRRSGFTVDEERVPVPYNPSPRSNRSTRTSGRRNSPTSPAASAPPSRIRQRDKSDHNPRSQSKAASPLPGSESETGNETDEHSRASSVQRPIRKASRRNVSYEDDPDYLEGFVNEEQEQSQEALENHFRVSIPIKNPNRKSESTPRHRSRSGDESVRRSPRSPIKSSTPLPRSDRPVSGSVNGRVRNGQMEGVETNGSPAVVPLPSKRPVRSTRGTR